jgi:Nuclease-related domain/AAA domain
MPIFPVRGPRPTSSHAERAFYEHLAAQLPESWHAWHSLALRVGASDWVGEGDFIVASPTRGLLILEVKGGVMTLEDGVWYQYDRPLERSPIAQATAFAHRLQGEIESAGGGRVPFGVACVFPDSEFTDVDAPGSGDHRGAVLGKRQLRQLDLAGLFDRVVRAQVVPSFAKWRHVVHTLWGERWTAHVRVTDQVSDAEQRVVELDRAQLEILEDWAETARAMITGRAGTGKTVVAREIALRRAAAGERVLYLCFTDALALSVDAHFAAARARGLNVHAAPVRKYAEKLLKGAGVAAPEQSEQRYWNEVSLHAAADALPQGDGKPTFVVVDEQQDFADADWTLVEALASGGGLWVFGDDRQRFWTGRKMPESLAATMGARGKLRVQRRSAQAIADLPAKYTGEGGNAAATAVAGVAGRDAEEGSGSGADASAAEAVKIVACPKEHIDLRIERKVDKLLKQGVKPAEIAILSLAGQTHARTMKMTTVAGQTVARADQKGAAEMIVADTCLRFKGLERAFVVIMDLPGDCEKTITQADVRMHIALTRGSWGARRP